MESHDQENNLNSIYFSIYNCLDTAFKEKNAKESFVELSFTVLLYMYILYILIVPQLFLKTSHFSFMIKFITYIIIKPR